MIHQFLVHREIEHRAQHIVLRYHLKNFFIREVSSFRKSNLILAFQLGKTLAEHVVGN